MSKIIKIWSARPPRTYKRVLLRCGCGREFSCAQNWKFNFRFPHFNIITPIFRLTKCNGKITFGMGNHYLEIGY